VTGFQALDQFSIPDAAAGPDLTDPNYNLAPLNARLKERHTMALGSGSSAASAMLSSAAVTGAGASSRPLSGPLPLLGSNSSATAPSSSSAARSSLLPAPPATLSRPSGPPVAREPVAPQPSASAVLFSQQLSGWEQSYPSGWLLHSDPADPKRYEAAEALNSLTRQLLSQSKRPEDDLSHLSRSRLDELLTNLLVSLGDYYWQAQEQLQFQQQQEQQQHQQSQW
jgi:hypothetical protein